MLTDLELLSLKERHSMNRLIFFYKVVVGLVPPIPSEDFLKPIHQNKHIRAKNIPIINHQILQKDRS